MYVRRAAVTVDSIIIIGAAAVVIAVTLCECLRVCGFAIAIQCGAVLCRCLYFGLVSCKIVPVDIYIFVL